MESLIKRNTEMKKNLHSMINTFIVAFGLLSFYLIAGVNLAYAVSNNYEVTFARVSNNFNFNTAGCLIVHSNYTNEKNVYCRYQLDKQMQFLRDDDKEENALWEAKNVEEFQTKIINWFKNKYDIYLTKEEASYMAHKMSSSAASIFLPIQEVKLNQNTVTDKTFATSVHKKLREEDLTKNAGGITFVRIDDKSNKQRADCLSFKNIYCRYGNYKVDFWVDDNKEEDILLKMSRDIKTFQKSIMSWFQKKYHTTSPTQEEVAYIAYRMSGYNVSNFFSTQIITLKKKYETEQEFAEAVHRRLLTSKEEKTIVNDSAVKTNTQTNNKTQEDISETQHDYQPPIISPVDIILTVVTILVLLALIGGGIYFFFSYLLKRELERFYNNTLSHKFRDIISDLKTEIETINNNEYVIQLKNKEKQLEIDKKQLKNKLDNTEQRLQNLSNHIRIKLEVGKFFERQDGVQRWLQSVLLGELLIFESIIKQIESYGDEIDQRILEVLYLNSAATEHNIMRYWDKAVAQYFESDDKLWNYLYGLNGGHWLSKLLRANDILQAYFSDRDSLKKLSQQLLHVRNILEMAFQEMGIELISPHIFEEKPNNITQRPKNSLNPYLKEVAASKIDPQLKMKSIVVDIQRYGFKCHTNLNAENDVIVFDMNPSQWKGEGKQEIKHGGSSKQIENKWQQLKNLLSRCRPVITQIEDHWNEEDQQILKVLHLDNIAEGNNLMQHWNEVASNAYNYNDELRKNNNQIWLHNFLRANDILSKYFSEKDSFRILLQDFSEARKILESILMEQGVKIISPTLLEEIPEEIIQTNIKYQPNSFLLEKAKLKIEAASINKYYIIDIEKYGFDNGDGSNSWEKVVVFAMHSSRLGE